MALHSVGEGDAVVLILNNGDKHFVTRVKRGSKVKLGRDRCCLDGLIGCPYGSLFGLAPDGVSLQKVAHVPSTDWDVPTETQKNNAGLIDDNTNQTLDAEAIEALRKEGKSGEEIVAALAAASKTFESKTEFAQAKYKKKKAKKHSLRVEVQPATAAAVAEAYYSFAPSRIGHLRLDTMAIMLSLANVGAYARVLVVEACGGLLTAAVAERLGGYGALVSAWPGAKAPGWDVWRACALSSNPALRAPVTFMPLAQLLARARGEGGAAQPAAVSAAAAQQPAAAEQEQQQAAEPQTEGELQPMEEDMPAAAGASSERPADAAPAAAAPASAQEAAPADGPAAQQAGQPLLFNSCLIAAPKYVAAELLRAVRPLLAPSASFAMYSPFAQPLAEALHELRSAGQAVNLLLRESWWREIQVLPGRTHPMMNMDHGGGFILSGTIVISREEEAAVAAAKQNQQQQQQQAVQQEQQEQQAQAQQEKQPASEAAEADAEGEEADAKRQKVE